MSSLDELYHPTLMARARAPIHAGHIPGATCSGESANPLCGDEAAVDLVLVSGVVVELKHRVKGCSICKGSADLMADRAINRTPDELRTAIPVLGELPELAGVRAFPARLACAELPWRALAEALKRA